MGSILKLAYMRQKFEYTCGPTVLHMVLHSSGIKTSRRELIRACNATPTHGTSRLDLVRVLRNYGLRTHGHSNSSFKEIQFFIEQNIPVIVNYRDLYDKNGHYAVAVGIKRSRIYLHDPYHGPHFSIPLDTFQKHWYGYHTTRYKRWILAASTNRLPVFHR